MARRTDPRDAPDFETRRERALAIHERLCPHYGCPIEYFNRLDPLEELVSSFLNHRTRNRDAKRAYEALRARFPTWEEVRDADENEIVETIAGVRWPEMKAPRLKTILTLIGERRGRLDLDHLAEMSVTDARAWLEELPDRKSVV